MYGVLPLPWWSQRWFNGDAAGRELTRHTTEALNRDSAPARLETTACVLPACRCRWMPASSTTAARRAAQPRRADGPALLLGSRVRHHHADEARPGRGGEATGRGLLRAACLPLPLGASQQHQRRGVQRNRAEPTARRGSLGNKRYLKLQPDAAAEAAAWGGGDAAIAMAVEDGPSIGLWPPFGAVKIFSFSPPTHSRWVDPPHVPQT